MARSAWMPSLVSVTHRSKPGGLARPGLLALFLASACAFVPALAAAQTAQRIVSLDLCTDWMLARHAAPARVAALSPLHRQYPVPWVGSQWPVHDGSLERIVALKPDLVITGEYNALLLRARLKSLGTRVEILPLPKTLDEVVAYETRLLDLLDLPAQRASRPPPDWPQTSPAWRLLLLGANGIGTGRGTFEDGILRRAGWGNYLDADGYVRLDLEQVVVDPPDAVLWAAPEHAALANRFAEHPAVRRAVPESRWLTTDYWRWQCPGPWTWELIGQLHRWLD